MGFGEVPPGVGVDPGVGSDPGVDPGVRVGMGSKAEFGVEVAWGREACGEGMEPGVDEEVEGIVVMGVD